MGCNLDCVCMKHWKRDIRKVARHVQHFGVWKGLSGGSLGHCIGYYRSQVLGVLVAGQNGQSLLVIEASCGKSLSKIRIIICDSRYLSDH